MPLWFLVVVLVLVLVVLFRVSVALFLLWRLLITVAETSVVELLESVLVI